MNSKDESKTILFKGNPHYIYYQHNRDAFNELIKLLKIKSGKLTLNTGLVRGTIMNLRNDEDKKLISVKSQNAIETFLKNFIENVIDQKIQKKAFDLLETFQDHNLAPGDMGIEIKICKIWGKAKNKLNTAQELEVIKLYKEGLSTYRVAELFSLNRSTITGYLKRNNVKIREARFNKNKKDINIENIVSSTIKKEINMSEQRKNFAIEFNYLEMSGLHDYARFKNLNLKDIVLQALEKEIVNDKKYLDSLSEEKRDFLIAMTKHELIENKAPVKITQPSKILNVETKQEPEENIVDDLEEELEEIEEKEIEEPVKKGRGLPRFLRDTPIPVIKPKKKKKKIKQIKKKII